VTRIVTTVYRYEPPPRKRKAAPAIPAIVTRATRRTPADAPEPTQSTPNGDTPAEPAPPAARSAIVTTTSRKRAKLERAAGRAAEPDDDPEATARVKAFFARMIRPR
jgi:hypothetical protein